MNYRVTERMTRLIILSCLLSLKGFACAFHEFPPFGADWYHSSFFQLLYNSKKTNTLGFLQTTSNFSRCFYLVPELPGEEAQEQLLKEQIANKTFYYQLKLLARLQCRIEVTQTNVDADAAADDGILRITSTASNQISLLFAYDLQLVNRRNTKLILQPALGGGTNKYASHVFYSKIAWLKYQWNKFSPRLQAGNVTYSAQTGLSSSLEHKHFRAYTSINFRNFAVNQQGYHYGKELNSFFMAGYLLSLAHNNLSIEPQAGVLFEKASSDSKESYLNKDEDVFAGGQDVAVQVGGVLSIHANLNLGINYLFAFTNKGFTEFQLYNTSRTQVFLQYSF